MELTKKEKESIFLCISDLEHYYETCGNVLDFENLVILKKYLNLISLNLVNIKVIADVVNHKTVKNK